MTILTIKKFKNLEGDFTYGLYDGEEELFSCISSDDADARRILTLSFRIQELDERYGKGNWKIEE